MPPRMPPYGTTTQPPASNGLAYSRSPPAGRWSKGTAAKLLAIGAAGLFAVTTHMATLAAGGIHCQSAARPPSTLPGSLGRGGWQIESAARGQATWPVHSPPHGFPSVRHDGAVNVAAAAISEDGVVYTPAASILTDRSSVVIGCVMLGAGTLLGVLSVVFRSKLRGAFRSGEVVYMNGRQIGGVSQTAWDGNSNVPKVIDYDEAQMLRCG